MVLSYARGSWQFKVASSVAVAVRYGNVGGIFSGNEALVASLMAECDGMHTISFGHAMCHLLFPLTRRVFSPCHIFCQGFATCVAIAFARNASLPFRCHVCCQGLLLAAKILPFNLLPVLLPPPSICQCFLPPMLPLHLPPSVFSIHVALQIATAIAIAIAFALKVAIFVAIKFGRLIEHCS